MSNINDILDSNEPKKIGPILKICLFQSENMIEKAIHICFNNYNDEKFFDFLRCAIYNDKDIVFKIMDNYNFTYEFDYFKNLAITFKAIKCNDYFISKSC
jgi:hypothetical protein